MASAGVGIHLCQCCFPMQAHKVGNRALSFIAYASSKQLETFMGGPLPCFQAPVTKKF